MKSFPKMVVSAIGQYEFGEEGYLEGFDLGLLVSIEIFILGVVINFLMGFNLKVAF